MDATDLTTLSQGLAQSAVQAAESVSGVPVSAHVLAGVAIAAGFIMWCAGRRFVRPLYALAFALLGGTLGFTGPATIGLEIDPSIGMLVGGVLGAILGVVMYRFTMASTLGIVGGVAAPMLAVAALNFSQDPGLSTGTLDQADLLLQDTIQGTQQGDVAASNTTLDLLSQEAGEAILGEITTAAMSAAEQVRSMVIEMLEGGQDWFASLPGDQQVLMIGVTLVGAAVGFLLGFSFPGRVSAVGTAFVGAAIWLPALVWLIRLIGVEVSTTSQWSPLSWLVIWVTVSVAGVLLQWTSPKPRADDA
ncbi:MAG: hypothetical protein ACYTF7_12410 [Planctomycetota bacterium]|jgi:hypothetical protein